MVEKFRVKKVGKTCYCECCFKQWENKTAPTSVLKIKIKIGGTYESAVNFELQGFLLNPLDS